MNVADAAYKTVHDYPGGADALAARIGTTGPVLRNKVNPTNDRNKLTLEEAVEIADFTNDDRMLQTWASRRGKILVDAEPADVRSSVIDCVLDAQAKEGMLSSVLLSALSDGSINEREMREIQAAAIAVQSAVLHLVARCEAAKIKPASHA